MESGLKEEIQISAEHGAESVAVCSAVTEPSQLWRQISRKWPAWV